MIRKRPKRPSNDKLQAAPANPTSASAAPPDGAVPPGGDEASPVVIDELLAAFSVNEANDEKGTRAKQIAPPAKVPTQSTRAMSPTEMVGQVANVPPPQRGDAELVPEPTRRSARRSKREAKREAKGEKKRLAKHDNEQQKAAKQSQKQANKAHKQAQKAAGKKRQSRKARRQGKIEGSTPPDSAAAAGVRVISAEEAAISVVLPAMPAPAVPTVRIADDELPDPVYVEGDLDAGGRTEFGAGTPARSTVFIDEDPSHADVVTMDVATSATRIEPRMRERRIAVRRAVGRRRLKWIAIVTVVVLIVVGALAVLGSALFAVKEIDVEGAVYSVGPAFDAVIEELDGANVLRIDTDRAERDLEAIPWIADARVTTDFPNGATIEVRERAPSVAYQGPDGRYRVLDRDGRVLDVIDGQPTAYLELLVTDGTDLDPGQMAPPGYRAAATLAQALTPQMRQWVLSLSASADATDLRLLLDRASVGGPSGGGPAGGIEVRFGAAEDLVDKLVRLQTALTNPDPDNVPTEMIDVSTADVVDR